jgi:hypothetical protein
MALPPEDYSSATDPGRPSARMIPPVMGFRRPPCPSLRVGVVDIADRFPCEREKRDCAS